MKKIMFNDKFGLTQAVLDGRKTMTRRIIKLDKLGEYNFDNALKQEWGRKSIEAYINNYARYKVGEVIAIAQSYETVFHSGNCPNDFFVDSSTINKKYCGAGFKNKMFVKADLMPHHIEITGIKVERLQEISDEDCLKEGIIKGKCGSESTHFMDAYYVPKEKQPYCTPRNAFAALIDKVSSKGTWESNPFVFAYEFRLTD
ncbi:hypothetical protein PO370_07700 [Bacteroides ovatus]|uniref:hypothetical protein n=1 Tax=Bacteroides ovatus TaxID=28116 RepID=UPI00233F1D25|nr:hypothetical protein [Bacteroides ovatus]MDC2747264.1 hypothetical protein [Bacteroides ovatus]